MSEPTFSPQKFVLTRPRKYTGPPWDALDDEHYLDTEKSFDAGTIVMSTRGD